MEELVTYIVKSLVMNKDDVKVESAKENENTIILKVTVNPSDLGKVIGKNGKVANSIRAIVKSAQTDNNVKYFVKIME
ncbi:MAG: KH domain-containing protein [Christensenellales bacterium]